MEGVDMFVPGYDISAYPCKRTNYSRRLSIPKPRSVPLSLHLLSLACLVAAMQALQSPFVLLVVH